MNWTPENDRLLLLKLVETHNLSVQYEAIARAWRKYIPLHGGAGIYRRTLWAFVSSKGFNNTRSFVRMHITLVPD